MKRETCKREKTDNQNYEFICVSSAFSISVHLRSNFEFCPLAGSPDCLDLCKNDNSDCKNSLLPCHHDTLSAILRRFLKTRKASPPLPGATGIIARKTTELADFSGKRG